MNQEKLFPENNEETSKSEAESVLVPEVVQGEALEVPLAPPVLFTHTLEPQKELQPAKIQSIIESILFVANGPITIPQIKEILNSESISNSTIRDAMTSLKHKFDSQHHGIELFEVAMGFELRTKLDNLYWLKQFVAQKPARLSQAALETLSIISYKQPITRAEIDKLRGVDSSQMLRNLVDRKLIKIVGRSEHPGRPPIYGTTQKFLETFSLKSLKELPPLKDVEELDQK